MKCLECNILGFVGIALEHETLMGSVDTPGEGRVTQWLARLRKSGLAAD